MKKKTYAVIYSIFMILILASSVFYIIDGSDSSYAMLITNIIFVVSLTTSWLLGFDLEKKKTKKQKLIILLIFLAVYITSYLLVYLYKLDDVTYALGHTTKFLWLNIEDSVAVDLYSAFINSITVFIAVLLFQVIPFIKNKINKKK